MTKTEKGKKQTALLLDANALLHRAWHALPPLTTPSGQLVNAVYGFLTVLLKALQSSSPDFFVVCWDTAAPTFRHKAAPEYKAQREEQPQEFYDQAPLVKELVSALGGHNVELDGYEADDLLATIALHLSKAGVKVTLLTSDRDMFQVIGRDIEVMAFKKGVSETVIYDEKALKENMGLTPSQIADYKALRGDASDNLKGVPGIGEKTAIELLIAYGDLKSIFKAAHNPKSDLKPGVRSKLVEGEGAAMSTLPLVKVMTDAPISLEEHDLKRDAVDETVLKELLLKLGFKTLYGRIFGKDHASAVSADVTSKMDEEAKGARTDIKDSMQTEHVLDPDKEDVRGFILEARKQERLIVWKPEVSQDSLFAEAPVFAVGHGGCSMLLTPRLLEDKETRKDLSSLFADASIGKTGHDMKRVYHALKDLGMALEGVVFDTEIASYLLAAGEGGHDLKTLAAARLATVLPEGQEAPLFELDAIRDLESQLSKELEAEGLAKLLRKIELPLIPILADMEAVGILIDRMYFKTLAQDFRQEKTRLEDEMKSLAGGSFNPGSPQQLANILFEVLKLPSKGIKRGKTGISTAASELAKLEGAHPIISRIADFREVSKLLSTYVEALPEQADGSGRVHTSFNQVMTSTGRLSSSNPNLQNIPIRTALGRKIRKGFVAPKGFSLLSCDYSQIELRVVAALAHDKKMLEAFENDVDIHAATASAIWDTPLEKVTKEQRRAAKAINFGIIYGQGPVGLARSAGISFDEAKTFIEEYFHIYSGVHDYLDQTKALARSRGYVETLFGRRRPMPDIKSPRPEIRAAAERMAINMPVQGTSADIIKLAMAEVARRLPGVSVSSRMLLQVHDELVFEVPEGETGKVAEEVVDIMQNIEKIGVPLKVDAKIGKNWDEMSKI